MDIAQVMQLIANFGLLPALCVFIIIFLLKNNPKSESKNTINEIEKFQKIVDELVDKVDKKLEHFNQKIEKVDKQTTAVHPHDEEKQNTTTNLLINTVLEDALNQHGANRATCVLFHNGGRDVLGRSFQKMSITHEKVNATTVPVISNYQNFPRMMLPKLIEKLIEDRHYYVKDIEEIKETDVYTYQLYKLLHARSFYIQSIIATNKQNIGYIVLEFDDVRIFSDPLMKTLYNSAVKISSYLEFDKAEVD